VASNCDFRFVFASVGYGPGVALYIVFGVFAGFSGWILWQVFLGLDSSRFPMLSFGDTYFRVYGKKARHFINIAQSFQQFMSVCVMILSNAVIIAQISNETICFIASMVICMVIGMITGSVRSLQRLGWLCNASVWMNVVSFIVV
jgi:amino acid permease